MKDAWREIYRHPRVRLAVDLGKVGFVVLGASSGEAAPYRVSIA
jgi:hypothetical protein